ncbi:MAG: hypothetical protein GX564_11100 [Oligosphaeraceae bacterium]|nr:hypothetical protein [Oligosphaeraceae bacterium]
MKSAFELAMERLGAPGQKLSQEQKEQLAEIDRVYEAKIAQAKFAAAARQQNCQGDPEKLHQVQDDLLVEIRSLESRRERQKEEIRQGGKEKS